MKKIIIPFFCAVLFSAPAAAQKKSAAPAKTEAAKSQLTPKDVLNKYFDALGGKSKLEAVKSIIIENTMNTQGMDISMTTTKSGNKFKSVQSVMGQTITQVFDGEKGYMDQMGQKIDLPADQIPALKKGTPVDALAFEEADFKSASAEKLDGKDYNVLVSDKGKSYFEASTGLLYKVGSDEGGMVVKNYMTVDGMKFPSEVEFEGKGQKATIKTTKITVNPAIPDTEFK
ncbi:MAG: hypothetical protein LBE92_09280 [Chryseobacterium sp.]|jgi:hypothetical protein|uniref:hypothetical protein n=1 Tax=Chryseobacterium sp. TaxID=1871047 RepID=UPI00281BEE67|nr:hypothetical protein [Chryseobacterium sp.]MDR2236304.1 hypothetical protein [Chryseobacterium sp.]